MKENEGAALKPCPFCGGENITTTWDWSGFGKLHIFCKCYHCGARGPSKGIKRDRADAWAWKQWNRRADERSKEGENEHK